MYDIGEKYSETFLITDSVVENFAKFSSDYNPMHVDEEFAKSHGYPRKVSHGIIQLSYLSKIIGMNFPGHGAIWMNQTIDWLIPVYEGDEINIVLTVKGYSKSIKTLTLLTEIFNQHDRKTLTGEAQVKLTKSLSNNCQTTTDQSPLSLAPKSINTDLIFKNKTDKKVALITGASRGIGEETARQLAQNGYKVIINYKNNTSMAKGIVKQILSDGGDAIAISADMSNHDDIEKMAQLVFDKWGRCDVVVHGASPPIKAIKVEDVTYNDIELYLNIYLKAAISLVSLFSKSMIQNKFGRFVFIGTSYLYNTPPNNMGAYVSAKEALWGYTKSLAIEMAHYGITSNMVSPSLTITDLTADIPVRMKEVEAIKSPARRLVTTKDTAAQIVHLCSESSNYINGVNLPITSTPV